MNELSPQSKLEHIIYLVREYEADLTRQESEIDNIHEINSNSKQLLLPLVDDIADIKLIDVPSIEPKATIYLERITAFLE